jgi:hypothetical protein
MCLNHRYPPYTDFALGIFRFAMALPVNQPSLSLCTLTRAAVWAGSVAAASALVIHFYGTF